LRGFQQLTEAELGGLLFRICQPPRCAS